MQAEQVSTLPIEKLLPVVAAVGFGIQQFLQVIVDPIISAFISYIKHRRAESQPGSAPALPGGITDVDAKKALLGGTSMLLGLMIAGAAPTVRVLAAAGLSMPGWDLFITALTISAGTEGINSVVKLVQYVKDAVKAKTPSSVAQNSPAPQSPTGPAEARLPLTRTTRLLIDVNATEQSADVQSRAKE